MLDLKRQVDADLHALEQVRQTCLQLVEARRTLKSDEARRAVSAATLTAATQAAKVLQEALTQAAAVQRAAAAVVQTQRRTRPCWLARLFRTRRWMEWARANQPLVTAERNAAVDLATAASSTKQTKHADYMSNHLKSVEASRRKVTQFEIAIDAKRMELGSRIVDDTFFDRGHEAWNLASPWLPDTLHRKREDLFIAAMAVHKAFIDASAQKVLHNLSVLLDSMSSGSFQDEAKRALLGDLWSTLFLVIPVVSTTFASVDRMLGDLPACSIGWLLVDEGGQALPQAAVGALMRAKRAIVVGDPLQIPPVVSLPHRLTCEICSFFRVTAALWAAPQASSQTVADRASTYQATFRSDEGPRRVGVPLLVHRRCQEPMFGISNRIAYDGQMVHSPPERAPGAVGHALGASTWFDIDADADSKWCPAEGELVVSLLAKLSNVGVAAPDIYVITPFRIVAQELRRRLEREQALFAALGVDKEKWLKDRVGTIHTFQGKEAETVIVVLGAPRSSQQGARAWAELVSCDCTETEVRLGEGKATL